MDVHFNLFVSNLQNNAISLPNSQLLLRLISNLTSDDSNYPPIVQKVKAFKDRNEAFSRDLAKFIRKSKESLAELSKELDRIDDDPALVAQLKDELNTNQMEMHSSLTKIEPTVTSQINTIKKLSDHIFPPTEELFRKKVLERLEKNKNQQVPISKKLRCTICLDNDSDVIIKRTCKPPSNGIPTCEPPPSLTAGRNNSSSSTTTSSPTSPIPPRNTFCEKASCNCGPVTCMECVIKHYWSSSSNGLKSYSTCPCCRAEFCTKDIYKVEYINDLEEKPKEEEPIKVDNNELNNNSNNNITTTTTTTTSATDTNRSSSKKRKDNSNSSSDNKRFKEQNDTDKKPNTNLSFQKQTKSSKTNKTSVKISQDKSLQRKTQSDDESDDNSENKDEKNDHSSSNNNNNDNNNNNKNSNPFKRLISFWK
ncbi:hypothetical protein ACTFIV_010289 [Dictyostelium citrinum]